MRPLDDVVLSAIYSYSGDYREMIALTPTWYDYDRRYALYGDDYKTHIVMTRCHWTVRFSAKRAYEHARNVLQDRYVDGEGVISRNAMYSVLYAKDVICGRWILGEGAISKSGRYSCIYAKYVVKGPWPDGEKAILSNANDTYIYARDVICGRWMVGEKVIVKDPQLSCEYARVIIRGRWAAGEEAILRDISTAIHYALHVIGGRFVELEAVLMKRKNVHEMLRYINAVIEDRFEPFEKYLVKDIDAVCSYVNITRCRFPAAEEHMINKRSYRLPYYMKRAGEPILTYKKTEDIPGACYEYIHDMLDKVGSNVDSPILAYWCLRFRDANEQKMKALVGQSAEVSYVYAMYTGMRFVDGEAAISREATWAYMYARDIVKGRFREGEAAIKEGGLWDEYTAIGMKEWWKCW